jgi:hypothetical protein
MPKKHQLSPDARRDALKRLGLAAAVLYAAPAVTRLSQARAAMPSSHCPPGQASCGGPSNNSPKP